MFAAGALTLAAAVAPGWSALLALRLLTGVALAGVPAVAMAYVAEEVDAASVGAAMGLYIAGSALGGMGGRLVASLVADVAGWRWALGVRRHRGARDGGGVPPARARSRAVHAERGRRRRPPRGARVAVPRPRDAAAVSPRRSC